MSSEHFDERFAATDFSKVAFAGKSFEGCRFENCDFKGQNLAKSRFVSCSFVSCDLSNVSFANALLREPVFASCKLIGIQWVQTGGMVNPSFEDCNLAYSNFLGLKLKKTTCRRCNFREADLSQCDFSESDFRDSDFLHARIQGTTLLKADFRGAINYLIDPIGNKVRGARFTMPEAQGLLAGLGVIIEI